LCYIFVTLKISNRELIDISAHPHGPRHPPREDPAVAGPSGPGSGGDRRRIGNDAINRIVEAMWREIASEKTI